MPMRKLALLVLVLLMSGCFQQEAPRDEAPAVATAAGASSTATADPSAPRVTVQRSSAELAEESPTTVPQLEVLHETTYADVRR